MAPLPEPSESFHLPPLDQCLDKGHRLISWKLAAEALSNLDLAKRSPNLECFLLDDLSVRSLSLGSELSTSPTPQTKNDFETRTAAINVTPSNNGQYDIEQIKQDTLWLSQQAKIDEISALRIVILEWQSRPATRILEGYSEGELISLTQAIGMSDFAASSTALKPNPSGQDSGSQTFYSDNNRHERLLRLVLSEQEHMLEVNLILRVADGLGAPGAPSGRTYGIQRQKAPLPWIHTVMERVTALQLKTGKAAQNQTPQSLVLDGIKAFEKSLGGWEAGSQWSNTLDDPTSFELQYRTNQLRQMIQILRLISVQVAALDSSPPASAVQSWFEFVDRYGFFELLQAQSPDQYPFVGPLQAFASLITLQLLRLPYTVAYINAQKTPDRPPPVIHDAACRAQIDDTMRNAAERRSSIASPALFAWSVILQTLRNRVNYAADDSISDDDTSVTDGGSPRLPRQNPINAPTNFVEALESIVQNTADGDPVAMYAKVAVDECSVLNVISLLSQVVGSSECPSWDHGFGLHSRLALLELAREAAYFIDYKAEILECVLAVLGEDNFDDDLLPEKSSVRTDLATIFIHDNDVLVPRLLHQAYGRYPFELPPLLKLCKALVRRRAPTASEKPTAQPLCDPTPYFTQQLPPGFSGYELVREDENANGVRLTEDLPLISKRRSRQVSGVENRNQNALAVKPPGDDHGEFYIPRGTTGTVISDSKPFVVAWDHAHSPLRYLACLLSTSTASSNRVDIFSDGPVDGDSQADIISIFAKLLDAYQETSQTTAPSSVSPALWVLEEASDLLDRNQDIVSVVFDIFERELSRQIQIRQDSTIAILTSCVDFFRAALPVLPSRIWPLLARSEFLEFDGRGGRISSIISAESSSGSSIFLQACLSLFEALRFDVVSQSVSGKVPSAAVATRFTRNEDSSPRLPKKSVANIVLACTHTFILVLRSLPSLPLKQNDARPAISAKILRIFRRVILDVYGCDDGHDASEKLCGALAPAAKCLLDSFLASTGNDLIASAIVSNLLPFNISSSQTLTANLSRTQTLCTGAVLDFLTDLVNVSMLLDAPTSHFEQQLFRALPLFVRIYSSEDTHKSSINLLFASLVRKAGASESKPPSLLGHLGTDNAQFFLAGLKDLDRPLGGLDQEVTTWDLASTLVNNKQQWFTSFLVTGDTPKNSLTRKESNGAERTQPKTLLTTAIDTLSNSTSLHHARDLAMLRFVLSAQNNWPWVTNSIRKHANFLTRLTDYVADLATSLSRATLEEPNQTYAASLIAEIFAMYLHNMRQLGDVSFIETLERKLSFYRENAVAVPTYNASLHANLKRNLEKKFPGCSLNDFKRLIGPTAFGKEYCYDLQFPTQVLGYHQVWNGPKGFEEDFARANYNLSLVESQVLLLGSWKSLCVELCHNLEEDPALQRQMVSVVDHCLRANIESNLPEAIFEHLLQTRAELALVILQRLLNVRSEIPQAKAILSIAWDAIRSSGQDFEIAFVGNITTYYRTLLRILLLAFQPHSYPEPENTDNNTGEPSSATSRTARIETVSVLLEVATEVIGKGFRSLCSQLHEDGASVLPSDFALLTSILQSISRANGMSEAYVQLTLNLCDTGVQRFALALFTWSDRLTGAEDDPVFGDLSISFLRELTNITPMAEFLSTEGIISQIGTAPILSHLRDSQPSLIPSHLRLQKLWARGILPILLNILVAVGNPVALEATAFLNTFPAQLSRAAALMNPSAQPTRSNPLAGSTTLSSTVELHTLCMISRTLDQYQDSPAAAAAGKYYQELSWDKAGVKEDLEAWLQGKRAALRNRIVPGSDREVEMQRWKPLGPDKGGQEGCENRLEECVVAELKGALSCLGGDS